MAARTGVEPAFQFSCFCAIPAQLDGNAALICEEAKLALCRFHAELRSFRVRICPKSFRYCFGASD